MATYAQLQLESWWRAEIEPPNLAKLMRDLRAHYGVDANHIASKGDNNHLSGYHRSRAWIQKSSYCTNRSYSIKETPGNTSGGDSNWLAAVDFQPATTQQLLDACRRIDAAVRAGRLEKITEWYGNVDGDSRVDGYNNIANRVASSDSSHLWHLHLSFDRGRVNEDHSDVFAILTGGDDMDPKYRIEVVDRDFETITADEYGQEMHGESPYKKGDKSYRTAQLDRIDAAVAELQARPAVQVDAAAVAKALIADPAFKALLVAAAEEGANLAEDR